MATMINGAVIVEQEYEFGVTLGDGIDSRPMDYNTAKSISERDNRPMRMRVVYKTEWMDGQ